MRHHAPGLALVPEHATLSAVTLVHEDLPHLHEALRDEVVRLVAASDLDDVRYLDLLPCDAFQLERPPVEVDQDRGAGARLGSDPDYGARPLKRVIEERIVMPLSVELARRPTLHDVLARVTLVGDRLDVTID